MSWHWIWAKLANPTAHQLIQQAQVDCFYKKSPRM